MRLKHTWAVCIGVGGVVAAFLMLTGCALPHNPLGVLNEVPTREILERAQIHFQKAEYDKALGLYKWVIQRDPDNADYHYLAGMCYLLSVRHAESEYYFRTALAKEPGMLAACRGLAMSLQGQGKIHQAAAEWREVCQLHAERAEAFVELGRAEHRAGNLEEALAAFNTAVRLEPKNATAHLELGLFFEAIGRIDPALAQVQIAHRLEPNEPRLRARIVYALDRLQRRAADRQPVQGPGAGG